jgi:hypothetical protein
MNNASMNVQTRPAAQPATGVVPHDPDSSVAFNPDFVIKTEEKGVPMKPAESTSKAVVANDYKNTQEG